MMNSNYDEVVIVGVSSVMPKSKTLQDFWQHLLQGESLISEINKGWNEDYFSESIDDLNTSNSKWMAQCDGFDCFDNAFFNMSPAEADMCDPLQRIELQEVWKCIENSAVPVERLQEKCTSVIVGSTVIDLFSNPNMEKLEIDHHTISGSFVFFIPNRISNYFGFNGQSSFIDTGCSSSTVALADAVNLLKTNQCQYAIVSGINIVKSPYILKTMSKMGLFSKSGKCSTFDAEADGIVLGEGIITFLLTTKREALEHSYHIYGSIKGISVNHVAKTSGLVAPSVESQYELIKKAWKDLDFSPEMINYAELHGTGTRLGDPIEVEALRRAYSEVTSDKGFCTIGTVKPNIGHLLGASGMAGILKVLEMFENKVIPKQINIKNINPLIDLENSPFNICTENTTWEPREEGDMLRASVSSFGIAGVNSYVVLEEYPNSISLRTTEDDKKRYLFTLSAKSRSSLLNTINVWKDGYESLLSNNSLSDIEYTLANTRQQFPYRVGFCVTDKADLKNKIRNLSDDSVLDTKKIGKVLPLSLLLPDASKCNQIVMNGTWQKQEFQSLLDRIGDEKVKTESELYKVLIRYFFAEKLLCIMSNVEGILLDYDEDILLALCVSGAIGIEQLAQHYSDENTEIECGKIMRNLLLPNGKLVETAFLTDEYFEQLYSGLQFEIIDEEKENDYKLDEWFLQMNSLYEHQRAFKKYLQELSTESQEYFDVIAFISNEDNDISSLVNPVQKFILFTSLTIARVRLNKKWGIEYVYPFADSRIESICKLVLEKRISYGEAVREYMDVIRKNRNVRNKESKLNINQANLLIKGALKICEERNEILCQSNMINAMNGEDLFDIALSLWQQGINIDWKQCLLNDDAKGVALPTYCFEPKKFRMIYQTDYETCYNSKLRNNRNIKVKSYKADSLKCGGKTVPSVCFTNNETKFFSKCFSSVVNLKSYLWSIETENNWGNIFEECIFKVLQEKIQKNGLNKIVVAIDDESITNVNQCVNMTYLLVINLVKAIQKLVAFIDTEILFIFTGKKLELFGKALTPLFKTVYLENEYIKMRNVYVENMEEVDFESLIQTEVDTFSHADYFVNYADGRRLSILWDDSMNQRGKSIWRDEGVYIIFGGFGGIGRALADYIGKRSKGTLVLVGRRSEDDRIRKYIDALNLNSAKVIYRQLDITKKEELSKFFSQIDSEYGRVDGIFNLTAVLSQNFIENKVNDELRETIKSKVDASLYIDEITCNMKLDFICNFSSISSVIGDYGLCDYVYANGFMDEFSVWREALRLKGKRYGYTYAINWPFWANGGLSMGEKEQKRFSETTGMLPIQNDVALELLDEILSYRKSGQYCIANGELEKIEEYMQKQLVLPKREANNTKVDRVESGQSGRVKECVQKYFVSILSKELKMDEDEIDVEEAFENYGVDSILIHKINRVLVKDFGDISITLFFDYSNINQVVQYILDNYSVSELSNILKIDFNSIMIDDKNVIQRENECLEKRALDCSESVQCSDVAKHKNERDIAIIGMSGRFPGANNLDEYWKNLISGKDCISIIPKNRWDWEKYYDENIENSYNGKMYSKWGGFIEDIDQFDPYLFSITPADACKMDPQERMLLEVVYEALEYAGYSKTRIKKDIDGDVGVFVGSTINGYRLLVEDEYQKDNYVQHNAMSWSLANRVSYIFELSGPSYTVDSACSSSLSAIVDACNHLRLGNCKMAIVGGVNLHIHPSEYILRSQLRMLSSDGKCYSFGENANGYVPGEGVGAVILKPLNEAEKDGDIILGVIKGVATNHVGHPSGYTVPSKNAQSQVIKKALKDAKLSPKEVSLIEAHGTGTKLGDPIEIGGLMSAFGENASSIDKWCAISSVKSNIGHLEGASGIASIIKVILQLKNRTKVPSINCEELNRGIHFEKTPFFIQREAQPWISPNGRLTAGISSFGAGGANAHVIVSEYSIKSRTVVKNEREVPVFLSANTERALNQNLNNMIAWLKNEILINNGDVEISDIAYTTQVGRELLPYRICVKCQNCTELLDEISKYLKNENSVRTLASFPEDRKKIKNEEREQYVEQIKMAINNHKLDILIELALKGIDIDWNEVNKWQGGKIINMPSYAFDNDRYWISTKNSVQCSSRQNELRGLTLLLDANISDIYGQKFVKTYRPNDYFVKDHCVNGKKLLAGMAQLEMALEAGMKTFVDDKITGLLDVHYVKSIAIEEQKDVEVEIDYDGNDYVFTVYNEASEVCSTGKYIFEVQNDYSDQVNISTATMNHDDVRKYYQGLRLFGFEFGDAFQCICNLFHNEQVVLGKIKKPEIYNESDAQEHVIYPEQIDSALQIVFKLMEGKIGLRDRFLPIGLGSFILYQPIKDDVISTATLNSYSKEENSFCFDIKICSEQGIVLAEVNEYKLVLINKLDADNSKVVDKDLLLEKLKEKLDSGEIDAENLLFLLNR